MKMKQMILLAMSAVVVAFGANRALAQTTIEEAVLNGIAIESITKVVADGGEVNLPLSAETTSTIYFDVKLAKYNGATYTVSITGNEYNTGLAPSKNHNRPYLVLDIPLTGLNTKKAITQLAGEAEADAASKRLTGQARAYYQGPGANGSTLRFAYDVRPGDMTTEITWAKLATGAPSFGGEISLVKLWGQTTGMLAPVETSLDSRILRHHPDNPIVPADPQVWPVCGYTMTIGGMVETVGANPTVENDYSVGALYQGLVPVTISTPENAPAMANSTYSRHLYFWVETETETTPGSGTWEWKYCSAAVTAMKSNATEIVEAEWDPNTTFSTTRNARVPAPSTTATSFAPQTYFVNIPASISAGTKVRLCYGVRNDGTAATTKLYAYTETIVEKNPVLEIERASGYDVTCGEMSKEGDNGTFKVNGVDVNGGTINIAAGETVTLVVAKKNVNALTNFGTLYADIKQVSTENSSLANFSHRFIPIDSDTSASGFPVKLTIGENAEQAETIYAIRIPQLDQNSTEKDTPFYLKVISSKKRETITLTPGASGVTAGTEHYQPLDVNSTAPGSATFLEYKLTVPAKDTTRYFTILPVASDLKTIISKEAKFLEVVEGVEKPTRSVHEALKRYVVLQSQPGTIFSRDTYPLTVRVAAGETSATFYVACVNDFPYTALTGKVRDPRPTTTNKDAYVDYSISGANFIALSSNSEGGELNENDVCNGFITPTVSNRKPTIRSFSAPTSGGTGTPINFSFQVVDTYSDYLVATMSYGENGKTETKIYVDENEMKAILGDTAWATKKAELEAAYPGATFEERSANNLETITFSTTYTISSPTWTFTVSDSSLDMATQTGQLTLTSTQKFTFYTIADETVPASGYVTWDDNPAAEWLFGSTYTYSALQRSEGSTTVTATAKGYPAGSPKPAKFEDIDRDQDSFFYKWTTYSDDYAALLPGGNDLYNNVLTINRAFVSGGGEAEDYTKWHDIILKAIFVAEWRPSDARTTYEKSNRAPYLYELGDYNQDGVPDGWLLRNFGAEAGRPLVEGAPIATNAPEGDAIPAAGWANGEAAYRWQPAGTLLNYNQINGPGPGALGSAFGYRERLRGRDNHLNAADGDGNWLSVPIWEVLVHPMIRITEKDANDEDIDVWYARVAAEEGGDYLWNTVSLYDGTNPTDKVAFTAMGIPHVPTTVTGEDPVWVPAVDAGGKPMAGGAYATLYTLEVQINPDADDYETFRFTPVNGWGYGNAENWNPVVGDMPTKPVGGMLLDEAFRGDDPRQTSWLDRFAPGNADVDGDGVPNGYEYYFWYFASRMAWAPTFEDADGNLVIMKEAWPLVDPAKIRDTEEGEKNWNSDDKCGTTEVFVMGRKYRPNYEPDANSASFYADDGGPRNASAGKGNYWEPITIAEVMAHFDPYTASAAGDIDNDGLSTAEEILAGTNPLDCDTDNDWVPDGWEDAFELDPLNLGGVNDAEENPDQDFYASTELERYPDYHHVFRAEKVIIRKVDPETDEIVEEEVDYEEGEDGTPYYYYYDAVAEAYYKVGGTFGVVENPADPDNPEYVDQAPLADSEITAGLLNDLTLVEIEEIATVAEPENTVDSFTVTDWADSISFIQMEPETVRLRDFDVYKALGFDCRRSWSADQNDPHTQPFNSREEFNSAVARAGAGASVNGILNVSTDPLKADTNDDGIPDGWAAYVGFNPLDTTMAAKDLDEDGLNSAEEYAMGVDGWTNKTNPTDPRNPDTDFDTVSDGAERSYIYAGGGVRGGGMCPTNLDTDGDGMSDGWEFLYGTPSNQTMDSTITDAEGNTVVVEGTGRRGAPDPTANDGTYHDSDLDYDRDGLTNYQEYLVGLLRHLRYDLGPDAARLYKDNPGNLYDVSNGQKVYAWIDTPDVYSALEDLANPSEVQSIDYQVTVPILAQAWAANNGLLAADYSRALTAAFNRQWNSSIIFPTAEQLANYGLYALATDDGANVDKVGEMNELLDELPLAIIEFDAAYHRLLAAAGNDVKRALADRQIRALMIRIDTMIETLEAEAKLDTKSIRKHIANLLKSGETRTLWTERKKQVADYLVNQNLNQDAIYAADELDLPTYDYATMADLTGRYDATDYEKAVYSTTSSLLRTTYRAAVRGFNGGLQEDAYVGPLAQHAPIKPFAETWDRASGDVDGGRFEDGGPLLGLPMSEDDLGALAMPIQGGRDEGVYFPTTNPLAADTDADGMDDYWEIFHGLNPILGDTVYESSSAGSGTYIDDVIQTAYAKFEFTPTGDMNYVFNPPELDKRGNVTGYDYYTYPWLAGAPYADPDGDGLLNFEEAVNPVITDPAHYGTDPSPLWMTDKDNPNSFTARFYGRINETLVSATVPVDGNIRSAVTMDDVAGIMPANTYVYKAYPGEAEPESFMLPFEINEGYDTDGDGIGDLTELSNTTIYRGNPQALRTPDRQQAVYLGGAGAMQSFGETQFGPTALTTFTLECWVKPDADQASDEVVLIDRPWRFTDDSNLANADENNVRHNFVLGLKKSGADFIPYVNYTGAGTTYENGTATAPQVAPTVTSGQTIKANEWNHIAASYDGKRLVIILNGVETGAATSTLIPANGVIAIKNDNADDYRRFTYRKAPIIIGATPGSKWFAELGKSALEIPFTGSGDTYYANCYKGYIDEVRIWNGARTAAQIADCRRKTFTQAELLNFRYNAFAARYAGQGFYESNVPAEPLAVYTFNDLLAGELKDGENDPKPAAPATTPWERYPGEKLVGDDTVPGSFTYRRKGFLETLDDELANGYIQTALPTVTELFTSYYTHQTAATLRSTLYCEGVDAEGMPYSEFVPMAHNIITHLPVADVERDVDENELVECLQKPSEQDEGSPDLRFPSGSAQNLKVMDSVYWSPYGAGYDVGQTAKYSVKVDGNPYAYYYGATYTFDLLNYRTYPGYTFRTGTDLLIYGDAFAKYDKETWDSAPTTDPSAGQDDGTGTVGGEPEDAEWFEYDTTKKGDEDGDGNLFTDIQLSQGGNWLDKNIAVGQKKDADGDLMPNWWENYYGLDPEDPTGDNGPHGDSDGDYLTNYAEYLAKANPNKYSTVGNGVPDAQIPIWFRRGRPTFALLYTDNDMMEDHWEAANRSDRLSVDLNDAYGDADGDGWSNFAEARAGFRGGKHSTNPNAITSISNAADGENVGKVVFELPTPALRMTVDYFGDQNVYTNALDDAQIVVHAYTAKNNNSAPDAVFALPMFTASGNSEPQECTQDIGNWARGVLSGYLHLGNIVPSSFVIEYARHFSEKDDSLPEDDDYLKFEIIANTAVENDVVELYCNQRAKVENDEGEEEEIITRTSVGTLNCTTGYYELDFTDEKVWPDYWYYEDDNGTTSFYSATEFVGEVAYKSVTVAGTSSTFTLAKAASGYLKEGKNNFFVFADLNSNGSWENGEPAGIPDQHDVEIGFDQVNRPLHVTLTTSAPPGAVRLDMRSILNEIQVPAAEEEEEGGDLLAASDSDDDEGNPSSVLHPITKLPLDRDNFSTLLDYELILTQYTSIANGAEEDLPPTVVYRKQYNDKKPYLTEDEIYSYSESGLPGTFAPAVKATTYRVFYVPTTLSNLGIDAWEDYNIAIVTNKMDQLDVSSTKIVSPIGGEIRHNTDLAFEWLCNVQVPTFTLSITKTVDGSGNPVNIKVYEKTVRGITPIATAAGNGAVEQFRYRYMLPRGIGEIAEDKNSVFGNGSYEYTLTLNPYNGDPVVLKTSDSENTENACKFLIRLRSSGDATMTELPNTLQDTIGTAQDSHYVRTRIRYNGILAKDEDFDQRRIIIEAHYSASFNGDPIAATSDFLVYDALNEDGTFADDLKADAQPNFYTNLRNRCVRMVKDKQYDAKDNSGAVVVENAFYSTRFDAEIRGFATNAPVYLVAYFDLNGNGKRDAWEPWGYATQGLSSTTGFYFDPRAVTPVNSGTDYLVEFYIQDVDTDSDKLADSWEWLSCGKPTSAFEGWCGKFGSMLSDHHNSGSIWVETNGSTLSADATTGYGLTAYGAQLYGLTVTGEPDANGAVPVEGLPADTALAAELYSIIGPDAAQSLFNDGYLSYGLTITNIIFDGEKVKLSWDVTSAVGVGDGATYDLTSVFTNNATDARYAVYGKTSIADTTWTKVGEVKVAGGADIEVPATITVDGEEKPVSFFKVILSAKTLTDTIED